jgi:hypothetical protein
MAVSVERETPGGLYFRIVGNQRETSTVVTMDNSYAEGGEPLTKPQLGLTEVHSARAEIIAGSESSTLRPTNASYVPSEEKLHLIDSATGKEVEATKDMSKVKVRVTARGW